VRRALLLLALGGCHARAEDEVAAPMAHSAAPMATAPPVDPRSLPIAITAPPIAALKGTDAARGRFDATTAGGETYRAQLATADEPAPQRRPLAYFLLGQALGLDVVAPTRAEGLALADVVGWVSPADRRELERSAIVANDGTIMALLEARPAGERVGIAEVGRTKRWAEMAASAEPVPDAERPLVAGYVGVVVLDYLSANVLRAGIMVDEAGGRVRAIDNQAAFPGWLEPDALDIALGRVAPLVRFPKGLQERLRALDRHAFAALIEAKRHADGLLGPRQLADYADRRATLLSLLAARAVQYEGNVAFSL
jgi:hypothetical protein